MQFLRDPHGTNWPWALPQGVRLGGKHTKTIGKQMLWSGFKNAPRDAFIRFQSSPSIVFSGSPAPARFRPPRTTIPATVPVLVPATVPALVPALAPALAPPLAPALAPAWASSADAPHGHRPLLVGPPS